jgi:hypothetical protein
LATVSPTYSGRVTAGFRMIRTYAAFVLLCAEGKTVALLACFGQDAHGLGQRRHHAAALAETRMLAAQPLILRRWWSSPARPSSRLRA